MFGDIQTVKAISIVTKAPRPWKFFGLNEVQLLVEPYAFMIVSGEPSAAGETCLVARNGAVAGERCLEAIAAGDGREVFTHGRQGSIVSSANGKCLTIDDISPGRQLAMEACPSPAEARDGRSYWERPASGTLKTKGAGSLCVGFASAQQPSVNVCAEAGEVLGEASKVFFVAVPAFDPSAVTGVQNGAVLLKAAAARQRVLLSKLQGLWPRLQSCKHAADVAFNRSATLSLLQRLSAASAVGRLLPVMVSQLPLARWSASTQRLAWTWETSASCCPSLLTRYIPRAANSSLQTRTLVGGWLSICMRGRPRGRH
jgi:hypothetical protein